MQSGTGQLQARPSALNSLTIKDSKKEEFKESKLKELPKQSVLMAVTEDFYVPLDVIFTDINDSLASHKGTAIIQIDRDHVCRVSQKTTETGLRIYLESQTFLLP